MSFLPSPNARLLKITPPPVKSDSYSTKNVQPEAVFDYHDKYEFSQGVDAYLVPSTKSKDAASARVDFLIDRNVLIPDVADIEIDYEIELLYPHNSNKTIRFKVKNFEYIHSVARAGYYQIIGEQISRGKNNGQ